MSVIESKLKLSKRPERPFAWKLFYRFAGFNLLAALVALVLSGLGSRSYFRYEAGRVLPIFKIEDAMALWDHSVLGILFFLAIVFSGLAFYVSRRLLFPLGRLLVKTQNTLENKPIEVSLDDLKTEALDEWADLETNIDGLRKNLEKNQQRLSREQVELETIVGAISDAIVTVDQDGRVLFFNSRLKLLVDPATLENSESRLWGIFRDPLILNAFEVALKEGRPALTRTIQIEPKDGLRQYFSLSVSPLRRTDGKLYGAVGVFHDVTELKAAEQMRIDFVANVSHELRTPLTVIKGYADTLMGDFAKTEGPNKDFIASIVRNSDRLLNLMNDLLDLSSIESTDILQKDNVSILEFSERVVTHFQLTLDKKNQHVSIDAKVKQVYADPHRLEQVVINLLSNANKYTPEGGEIQLIWEAGPECVFLKVKDSGPGIPIEHQARLFERFYRIDKARSREQGGTGLGLAIVKHIMQRHEGAVWVDSRPGDGATFICQFPRSLN